MVFEYRPKILAALVAHGVRPTTATPPALVKDHVTALYLYELRALRAAMMRDEFPKREYAERVARLRERYTFCRCQVSDGPHRHSTRFKDQQLPGHLF